MSDAYVYIAECSDGTYYTGWTTDIGRRLKAHNEGAAGAKYTRSRRPVHLVYQERCATKVEALRREYAIKGLTRAGKEALVRDYAAGQACEGPK